MADLDELNRQRLDGIITKAVANGESEDTIKAIIDDYKGKYAAPSTFKQRDAAQGAKGSPRPDYVNIGGESPYQGLTRTTMGEPLANAAPTLASMAAPEGGVLSTGAGIGIKTLLQKIAPNLFGQSETPVADAGKDLLFNNLIPSAVGKGLEFAGDPRGTTARAIATKIPGTNIRPIADSSKAIQRGLTQSTIDEATGRLLPGINSESSIIESAAGQASQTRKGLAQDIIDAKSKLPKPTNLLDANGKPIRSGPQSSPELDAANEAYAATFGSKNRVGQALVRLNQEASNGNEAAAQAYKNISNTALSDITHVRNFKLATGVDNTINDLAYSDLLGPSSRNGTIDADALLNKLNGPKNEIYKEALGENNFSKISDLLTTIKDAKASMPKDTVVLPYAKRLAIGAITAPVLGSRAGAGITGTLILGEMALKKVMSDPAMAELVTRAIKTPSAAPEASLLTKSILQGLKGTTLTLRQKDDKDITVTVGEDGQVQYGKPQ